MITGLLVAADDPSQAAGTVGAEDCRVLRWPDDGPRLVEQHWDRIGPSLDALTEQTGTRRFSPDEAAALPGVSTIAVMLALLDEGDPRPVVLVADPGALTGLVMTIGQLSYGQRRIVPMPLDILASLNRKLRGLAAMGAALSVSGALLEQLRTRGRWGAVVDAAGDRGARCARHLALAGIAVLPERPAAIRRLLTDGPDHVSQPWLDVQRCDDEYELLVPAPGLAKDSMILSRAGDDLIVTVDGLAHPIELPSGLKRCVVVGGRVTQDGVRIRFRPEEAKWRGR